MTVKEIQGDVFESGAPIIAHGCNTVGVMGAGVAREMRKRFPVMHERYQDMCDRQTFTTSGVYLYSVPEEPLHIANLATQRYPGRNAKLEYIVESMSKLVELCNMYDPVISPIAMPRIGAGIGGLAWDDVLEALEENFGSSKVDIHCYYL